MATKIYTNVTIDEMQFSIKRFDAKTGLKLARFIIAKGAPLIPLFSDDSENKKKKVAPNSAGSAEDAVKEVELPDNLYDLVGSVFESFEDEDIDMIVDKCLRVCYLNLPAGLQPVIDETGNYGVEEVEYDMALTMRLCFEAIKWGASDFFDEKGLDLSRFMKRLGLSPNP